MTTQAKKRKPVLIIGCSEAKGEEACRAYDLYKGQIFKLINSNLPDVHQHFEVLILSAEHGLIHCDTIISPYDTKMVSRKKTDQIEGFSKRHRKQAKQLVEQYSHESSDLYVLLTNDYLAAYDAMTKTAAFTKVLKKFKSVYVCRKHRGIGILRGRLKKILTNALHEDDITLFRSGLASYDEILGYSLANESLGASMAYISDSKRTHLLEMLFDSIRRGKRLFLDNGVITMAGKGIDITPQEILDQYVNIIKNLKPSISKKLFIVIPDNPFDSEDCLNIIKEHKNTIKWLAKRCEVILPLHRTGNMAEHAHKIMSTLGYQTKIRLGVPCKEYITRGKTKHPVALSLEQIETLFELKKPNGNRLFSTVHFLALSEVSQGSKYNDRRILAKAHGISASCDACRTTAVMGNEETSDRTGSKVLRLMNEKITKGNTIKSDAFSAHNTYQEYNDPIVYTSAADAIDENVNRFVHVWNDSMGKEWEIDVVGLDEEESIEYCKDLLCNFPAIIEDEMNENLKKGFWRLFHSDEHNASNFEKRVETFKAVFSSGDNVGIQTALDI